MRGRAGDPRTEDTLDGSSTLYRGGISTFPETAEWSREAGAHSPWGPSRPASLHRGSSAPLCRAGGDLPAQGSHSPHHPDLSWGLSILSSAGAAVAPEAARQLDAETTPSSHIALNPRYFSVIFCGDKSLYFPPPVC